MNKVKVGITMGDPAGIGPAIILKALSKLRGLAEFVVIGDEGVLRKSQITNHNGSTTLTMALKRSRRAKSQTNSEFQIINLENIDHTRFRFGQVKAEYGRASIEYLDKALELIKKKEIDCLVTCPISKEAINLAGFNYSGHTEYLGSKTASRDLVMMLLNKELKFSLVTRHLPIKKVPFSLDEDKIYKTIAQTAHALKWIFSIKKPRLVVCGLNPHASDNGVIGDEEARIIAPAVKKIKDRLKLCVEGPMSSDVAIYRARAKHYDAVIAMYHDQALIPLKLQGNDSGVNITLGLGFIRTSPLHGTAFDIAADPKLANPNSLIAAIKTADKCALNQRRA